MKKSAWVFLRGRRPTIEPDPFFDIKGLAIIMLSHIQLQGVRKYKSRRSRVW